MGVLGLNSRQMTIVVILLAGTLLAVLNQTLLSPALPVIMNDMGVDAPTVQWLTSGYSLVEAVIIPLSAFFIGRFSTRALFIGGISLFSIGSLLAAIAPVFGVLLLGRMFQAAATGVVMPMVFTVILLIFPRERRGSAMGLVSLIIGFAPAVGPSLSGVLVDTVGWRFLFLIVTALGVLIVLTAVAKLRNYGDFEKTSFDKPSVALCSLGLLAMLYGLSSITSSDQVLLCALLIVAGVILMFFFVRRQLKLETPLLRVEVLRTRNFAVTVTLVACFQAALVGTGVLLPIYLQNLLGYSALQTGLVMLPGAVLGAIIGFIAGRLFDRYGARKIIVPGSFLAFLGGAGLLLFDLGSGLLLITLVYTILAIGMQFTITPLNTWGINSLPNAVIQHANAVSNTLLQIGASLGTALLVSLAATSSFLYPELPYVEMTLAGDRIAFCATAVIMAGIFIAICVFVRDRDKEGSKAAEPILETMPSELSPEIPVRRAMNRTPFSVNVKANIREVAQILAAHHISGVPVIDDDQHVVGFVSDGDIMKYIGRQDRTVLDSTMMLYQYRDQLSYSQRVVELLNLNVMKIATPNVVAVESNTPLEDVCRILSERRIKKMPVLEQGKLVGSVSRSDIIRATMANLAAIEAIATKENAKAHDQEVWD